LIKATPKDTFCFSPVSLDRYRLGLTYPFSYFMRPAKGQRQQRHHLLQPLRISQPRLLQAESSFLKTPEQCLDLPPPGVLFYSVLGRFGACHDQVFSTSKLHPRYVQVLPYGPPHPFKLNGFTYSIPRKQPRGSHHLPARVADERVGSHSYPKINPVVCQITDPFLGDKLSISAQKVNRSEAKQAVKLTQQSYALKVVRASSLIEQGPHQRESNPLVADAEREDVDRCGGQAPICAIKTYDPGSRQSDQLHDEPSDRSVADVEATQESLDAFVAGIHSSRAAESCGNLSEVDGPDLDQSDEELSQEVDAGLVPGYIKHKRSLKRANVGHCAISFQEHLVMIFLRIAARWPLCIFKELFLSCT
jgi:hypothetical protein